MGKKKKTGKKHNADYSNYIIEELLGKISSSETETGWDKWVVRARFENKPATIDIRRLKVNENNEVESIGKGIALTNEEADIAVEILLGLGYGSMDCIENEVAVRKTMYGLDEKKDVLTLEV